VLLAGEFAYKIKKPLRLPFLDFSTLALRKARCDDELRLNRRFAPDIYLDLFTLYGSVDAPRRSGSGEPIEYAVRMRRFDEAGRLDHLCAQDRLQFTHLSDLARTLTDFHAQAHSAPPHSRFGEPREVLAPALENFQELQQLLPDATVQARLAALRDWTTAEFTRLAPRMQARKAAGHIRECHGDLHLANLVLIDGRVRMFDCIEFSEDLRWIDVASEFAFTYGDLLDHGQGALAGWFLNEVLSHSGDYEAAVLLPFYAVYRALVRAKVTAIRDSQNPAHSPADVSAYLALAEQLAHPQPARLVITHGLAGCGKTVASTRLLQTDRHARHLRLRSDVERRRLFGLAPQQHSGAATGEGIYAPEAHRQTYAHLHTQAAMLLRAGWSVVVDAAFLHREERAAFQKLAHSLGVDWAILAPEAPPAVLRERILKRQALGQDASEATPEVLARQMQWIEPLDAEELSARIAAG
jgi:aminoglycoside phosphotransferase family enzyme/predicted kinase